MPPIFNIVLDDETVTPEQYFKIVCKHLAIERYQCNLLIQKILLEKTDESLSIKTKIIQVQNQINIHQIFIEVLELFNFKWKYDPILSV